MKKLVKFLPAVLLLGLILVNRPEQTVKTEVKPVCAPVESMYNREQLADYIQSINPKVYDRLANEIAASIMEYSKKYHLSPIMVLAVARVESEFNVNAVSPKDARGLMQLSPSTWSERMTKLGIFKRPGDIHDPVKNIEAGCVVIRTLMDETKDFNKALNLYLGADSTRYRDNVNKAVGDILMHSVAQEANSFYKGGK